MRCFAGIELISEKIPYEVTNLSIRHLLEKNNLRKEIYETYKAHLCSQGMTVLQGTIIDATLIAAPNSAKNKTGERDPEMHLTANLPSGSTRNLMGLRVFRVK